MKTNEMTNQSNKIQKSAGKLNREDVIIRAARKAGTTVEDMTDYMDAIESVIKDAALSGQVVSLIGFGKFYVQRHAGHPIQFAKNTGFVDSYLVYKFSAASAWNDTLRAADAKSKIPVVNHKKITT